MGRTATLTPEQRAENKRASRAKTRNVTLDADILNLLTNVEDGLEDQLGFRPNHSQAIRWLVKNADAALRK